jgi:hypothetical protein
MIIFGIHRDMNSTGLGQVLRRGDAHPLTRGVESVWLRSDVHRVLAAKSSGKEIDVKEERQMMEQIPAAPMDDQSAAQKKNFLIIHEFDLKLRDRIEICAVDGVMTFYIEIFNKRPNLE